MPKDWVSVETAAARTGYGERHMRRLCEQGKIVAERVGKRTWNIYLPSAMEYERADPRGRPKGERK